MESKTTKQDVMGCLSTAGLPRDCGNISFYYQYYSKQEGQEMWLLWGEKVLIREILLNIYLNEILNGNRKLIARLLLHSLDY